MWGREREIGAGVRWARTGEIWLERPSRMRRPEQVARPEHGVPLVIGTPSERVSERHGGFQNDKEKCRAGDVGVLHCMCLETNRQQVGNGIGNGNGNGEWKRRH